MDRNTAAGDTEMQSIKKGHQFYLDSPIKRGGKNLINNDRMFMMAQSQGIQEEDNLHEGINSDTN